MCAKVRDGFCLLGLAGSCRLREDRVSAVVFWKEGKKKGGARAPLRKAPKLTAQTAAPPSPRFKLDATGRATARCKQGLPAQCPPARLPTCPTRALCPLIVLAVRGSLAAGSGCVVPPGELYPSDPESKPKPSPALPAPIQSRPACCPFLSGADWLNWLDRPPTQTPYSSVSGSNRRQHPSFHPQCRPHHQLLQSNRPAYQLLPLLHRGRFLAPSTPVSPSPSPSPSLALVLALAQRAARLLLLPAVTASLAPPPPPPHPIRLVLPWPWTLTKPHVSSLPPLFLLFFPPSFAPRHYCIARSSKDIPPRLFFDQNDPAPNAMTGRT